MSAWLDALAAAVAKHGRAALVTVAHTAGSTPREAGAAMTLTADAIVGTIGGGHLEYEAMRLAREALAQPGAAPALWLVRFPLAARLGQCCGGVVTLALATVDERALPWLDVAAACARTSAAFGIVGRLGSGDDTATRLVVTVDDARGTLGSSALDSIAVGAVRNRLAGDAHGTGLIETDGATLFAHVVRADAFPVLVFGNGHVGRALVQVLGALPARVRWIDARVDDFPAPAPANVEVVATDTPESEIRSAPRGAFVVVMTHSHAQDFDLLEAALARDDWRYLGLIGSKAKRAQFEKRAVARGVPVAALTRIVCPIGAGRIRSKEPGAIAVAVAAEMLAVREAARSSAPAHSASRRPEPIS